MSDSTVGAGDGLEINLGVEGSKITGRSTLHSKERGSVSVRAWLRLARVFQKIERLSSESFRCRNLSSAQFDVLAHVGASPGLTQQELADSLLVTKGNVCQLLDRMQQNGLLERIQAGRSNLVSLTPAGQAAFEDVVPSHEAFIADLLTPLADDEQAELLRLLRKLDRSLPI